ncbi:hypothetical protein Cgig2_018440 [Carnegiea gigantea]|uniref:EF-hand domain-containing protein n=1 Tax=Carnegiea gigantea TaxID=171969 RepID=A0A9Q1GR17_9CARY|nr:hypothetical protein Cgig2_018440 [Carnegiea gigantea]
MGGALGRVESPTPETKLEAKMVEAMKKRAAKGTSVRSLNTIILKFPKIDASFRNCKAIFEEFDEDKNGAIDHDELKRCFRKLEVSFTEEEIDDLFNECDINEDMRVEFDEFIVLLCLVYLLQEEPASKEMDWDKNGMVNFKEFLFAFTRWVGIAEGDDEEEDGEEA